MTRRQKCHVLTLSGLLIGIIFIVNIYFLRVISREPFNGKKNSTPNKNSEKPPQTINEKFIRAYSNVNKKFYPIFYGLKRQLTLKTSANISSLWSTAKQWPLNGVIYSTSDQYFANVLETLRTAKITTAENSLKGTQLKLLLTLEGGQRVLFKPQWYSRNHVIRGTVYSGKDRHNAEVVAFYLSMILDIRWVPLAVLRSIHLHRDIWEVATPHLRQTMFIKDDGSMCLYGKCFYCRRNESVCGDHQGNVEGAVILMVDQIFKKYRSPWQRTYNLEKQAEWEHNSEYCSIVKRSHPPTRVLDLVDAAIFDFLIQNGDRHHYETYNDRIVLLDNGKGFGNPNKDFTDILAPLYQCCVIRKSTWERLLLLSGGSLSEALASLLTLPSDPLASPPLSTAHLQAIDRRLQQVYSTIDTCVNKYGKVIFKNK